MRRRPHNPNRRRSVCGDLTLNGQPAQIAEQYEKRADEAAGDKDHVLEQTYRQHAEHWRREQENKDNV